MRFCDLFISYKIGLKSIKNLIPFTKLPLHRKVAVIITFVISIFAFILLMLQYIKAAFGILLLALILLLIFILIDSRKKNLEHMLQNHYSPYSQQRMDMIIIVLNKYEIDVTDINTIDLLISEAQSSQKQSDYLAPLKNPVKILGTIILPIIVYVAQKIGDTTTPEEMFTMAIQVIIIVILVFALIFAMAEIIKDIFYRDYNNYNEFISDLNQIKIFYANKNTSNNNL